MPDTPSLEQQVFDILESWYRRHRFYDNPTNDIVVMARMSAEICALIAPAPPHVARYTVHCPVCADTAVGTINECEAWLPRHWADRHARTLGAL
jgi:hypothetical protein